MKLSTTNTRPIIFLVTVLIVGYGSGCLAGSLGSWSGELTDSNQYDDNYIQTTEDGTATFDITVADTLDSQFTSFRIYDSKNQSLGSTPLMETSKTIVYQLAPGDFTIQISKGRNDIYGAYSIDGSFTPANSTPTETEENDTYDKASSISGNSFSGSLGYQRTASDFDNSDYFVYEQSAKGELFLNTTLDDTLASQNTTLYIYDSGNESITYFYLMSTNTTNYVSLAYGTTYYIQLFSGLNNLYGAYSVDLSFTPDTTTTTVPDTTTTAPDTSTTTTTAGTTTSTITASTTTTPCPPDYYFCGEGECCSRYRECCFGVCCPTDYDCDIVLGCVEEELPWLPCLLPRFYGEDSEEVELLRAFRDEVLSQSPVGQEIIELYYQWSPIIAKAMEEDGEFKEEVKEMIDGALELIGSE